MTIPKLTSQLNAAGASPRANILVADRCAQFRSRIKLALSRNYELVQSDCTPDSVRTMLGRPLDLVITGARSGHCDSAQLLRRLRSWDINIPLLTVAANEEPAPQSFGIMGTANEVVTAVPSKTLQLAVAQLVWLQQSSIQAASQCSGTPILDLQNARTQSITETIDKLFLHYQPIWSIRNQSVYGYECLMRSNESGFGGPPQFLRAAKRAGKELQVGRRIRELASQSIDKLPKDALLFVNVCGGDLEDPRLLDFSSEFAKNAKRVILEITEQDSYQKLQGVKESMRKLRDHGYRVAIDDLGAGHNGLAVFLRLSPDIAKLDLLLVRNIHKSRDQQQIVKLLVQYCKSHAIDVVAEGVEKREEFEVLKGLGLDLIQGYYIGRPSKVLRRRPAYLCG